MGHKSRHEQFEVKGRKDPKKLARPTKVHQPKVDYVRKPRNHRELDDAMEEYYGDAG
jgi:hypothetical protein